MTTGRGPGSFGALEYVLGAIDDGLPADIAVVFVNRERGESEATDRLFDLVDSRTIPLETLSSVAFRKARGGKRSSPGEPLPAWRTEFDEAVVAKLEKYDFSVVVLFGYMLIATEALYGRFTLLNDHPALPDGPIGTYQRVIAELIRTDAAESGCMMNIATGDLDRGPVVSYCRYPIRDELNTALWEPALVIAEDEADQKAIEATDLYADIRARGVTREQPFLAETLRAIAEGRISLPPSDSLDLTAAVDRALSRVR
jgi:phosphoribosylglycinamide formyltransferase 1